MSIDMKVKNDWYIRNPEKRKEVTRRYRENNREKIRESSRKWRNKNKEHCREVSRLWWKTHPEKAREYSLRSRAKQIAYKKKLYQTDVNFRLANVLRVNLRRRLGCFLKNGSNDSVSAIKNLGCSVGDLKIYLESLFQPGMTWDNWGLHGWHIDHFLPFAAFDLSNEENIKKVCHYTNLRPMWATENLKKGKKII